MIPRCVHSASSLLLLALFLSLASPSASSDPETPPARSGQVVYDFYCYQCHGYAGDARTTAALYLAPPPRDFTRTSKKQLTRDAMIAAVRDGRTGTAMMSFSRVLSLEEIDTVIDHVRSRFLDRDGASIRYHTPKNGWPGHDQNYAANAFATGELSLDKPWEELSTLQKQGKRIFLSICISCHDAQPKGKQGLIWESRAVSYPRSVDTCIDCHYARPRELLPSSKALDHALRHKSISDGRAISPYQIHGMLPNSETLSQSQTRGRSLFLANCAFCHAADGTGRNWIGSFLEPRPRQLSGRRSSLVPEKGRLHSAIRDGIAGTSMPAWKSVLTDAQISDIAAYLTGTLGSPAASEVNMQVSENSPAVVPQWVRSSSIK